jgi:hypothetical protein
MADGHNLGWKLAWAARGLAGESLLDSYEQERGPVGRANAEASMVTRVGASGESGLEHDFGVVYAPSPVIGAGPLAGHRAPHAWIEVAGRRRSTVELFDGAFTVIAGSAGDRWMDAGRALAAAGVPVAVYQVGADLIDLEGRLEERYRLGADGCVVVRPDGYVAWSWPAGADHDAGALGTQLAGALGRQAWNSVQ